MARANLCLSEFTSRYTRQATRLFRGEDSLGPTRDSRIRILERGDVCEIASYWI
jgi:hypothetical protein